MNIVTHITEFIGARALAVFGAGEVGGTVAEVFPHQPRGEMTLGHQFNLSFFRLRLVNGHSVVVGGAWISDIDRAYDEAAPVAQSCQVEHDTGD